MEVRITMSVEEIIAMLEKRMGNDILKDETMAAPKFEDGMRLLHDRESTFIELLGVTSPYSLERIYDVAVRKAERYENIFDDEGVEYISIFNTIANVWFGLEKGIRRYLDFDHFMEYVCNAVIEQLYPSLEEFLENWLILVQLAKQVDRPVNLYCENVNMVIRVLKRELNKKDM